MSGANSVVRRGSLLLPRPFVAPRDPLEEVLAALQSEDPETWPETSAPRRAVTPSASLTVAENAIYLVHSKTEPDVTARRLLSECAGNGAGAA